jgi:nitrogen fixation NifU-like protein
MCFRKHFQVNTDQYDDLYTDHILDHYESPYHKGQLDCPTCKHSGKNPLCGDHVELAITVDENGRVSQAYFDGSGCAISQAAASILCEKIEGQRLEDVEGLEAQDMLDFLKVPLTATRQRCGLLCFKVLKTMVYSLDRDGSSSRN